MADAYKGVNKTRNAKILKLWCDCHTYSDIARELKVSRNVVAGVIHRRPRFNAA